MWTQTIPPFMVIVFECTVLVGGRPILDAFVMLLSAGTCLGLSNIALGFALGVALAWGFSLRSNDAIV